MTWDVNVRGALITGTTSGIGRALLELYVRKGATVIAVNRRPVPELEARYPSVRFECVDVRSREGVASLVGGLAASERLPELFILNAGVNHVDNDDALRLPAYRDVIETNLFGVLNFVAPLTQLSASRIPASRGRHQFHGELRREPIRPRLSHEQARLEGVLRDLVQDVRGDRPRVPTGHAGSSPHPDVHDGRQVPSLGRPDQGSLFRIARRYGAGRRAVCADHA